MEIAPHYKKAMGNKIKNCAFCKEISDIKRKNDRYLVMELKTGYVLISWYQYFEGYTIFAFKKHVTELHQLDKDTRNKFLFEMSLVGEAIAKAFKPKKMNYAILGNADPHLHAHITPRYINDPKPQGPIWSIPKKVWQKRPAKEELQKIKMKLEKSLKQLLK